MLASVDCTGEWLVWCRRGFKLSGTVGRSGVGDTAGSLADGSYIEGTAIKLVASAGENSTFASWMPEQCVDGFSLVHDTICTANFALNGAAVSDDAQPVPALAVFNLAGLSVLLGLLAYGFRRR